MSDYVSMHSLTTARDLYIGGEEYRKPYLNGDAM